MPRKGRNEWRMVTETCLDWVPNDGTRQGSLCSDPIGEQVIQLMLSPLWVEECLLVGVVKAAMQADEPRLVQALKEFHVAPGLRDIKQP
jgi:hypothetical protein